MSLAYRLAADFVVVVHFAYAMTILVGQALIMIGIPLKWRWIRNLKFRIIHLTMILIVVAESWLGITCPLTTLEKHFRQQSGEASYQGDFIANAVHEFLFFELTPTVFTWIYSLFGAAVLITLFLAPPRRASAATEPESPRK